MMSSSSEISEDEEIMERVEKGGSISSRTRREGRRSNRTNICWRSSETSREERNLTTIEWKLLSNCSSQRSVVARTKDRVQLQLDREVKDGSSILKETYLLCPIVNYIHEIWKLYDRRASRAHIEDDHRGLNYYQLEQSNPKSKNSPSATHLSRFWLISHVLFPNLEAKLATESQSKTVCSEAGSSLCFGKILNKQKWIAAESVTHFRVPLQHRYSPTLPIHPEWPKLSLLTW